jgi:flagellin-like hook-associated protein FlgL
MLTSKGVVMLPPLGPTGRNIFAGLMPLGENERAGDRVMRRLAAGRMLAEDDPAALVAGLHIDAAIRALESESRTLQRRADLLATREGALAAASDMVSELQALATQAAGSTLSEAERQALEIEAASIVRAIEHTAGGATFAGEKLFNSTLTSGIGETEGLGPSGEPAVHALADVGRSLNIADDPALVQAIAEAAVSDLAEMRGRIGAEIAGDITPRSRAVEAALVNLAKAHSLVVDADYAREAAALMRAEILTQSSRYLLALDRRNSTLAVNIIAGAA